MGRLKSFTFTSWNVKGRAIKANNSMPKNYLKQFFFPFGGNGQSSVIDIVALQEVSRSFYEKLVKANIFAWHKYSLNEGATGTKGCALFGSKKFTLLAIDRTLFSKQMIVAELSNPTIGTLTGCSFHIPNGSNYAHVKRDVGDEIANWLTKKRTRTVFGIDANSPEIDHPDNTKIQLYKYDSRLLLGNSPIHNLEDTCRVYLNAHSELMGPIVLLREHGPLSTSFINYKRDENKTPVPHRYDHIYTTPDINVISIKYLDIHSKVYDDGDKRLSDHAMVVTELSIK